MVKETKFKSTVVLIMVSVFLSRIMGFVRTALIPLKMGGLSDVTDAYIAAFQVPDFMYSMLVGGAIASSLIPVLASYISKNDEKRGWRSVSSFINFTAILMFIIVILGMIFTEPLVKVFFSEYGAAKLALTVELTRKLMPIAFFMMLAGLCNGVMNSYNEFIIPAFGPCLYNLACVISIALLSNNNVNDGYGVRNVVLGITVCAGFYFLFQFIFAAKHFKNNYQPIIEFHENDFKLLLALAVPSLLTSTLVQVNYIISKYFAQFFDTGAVTALELANKTWQMPLGIIGQAIGIAMLPSLAAVYNSDKIPELIRKINSAMRLVIFLAIPSTIGLAVMSKPLIQVLFNFGTIGDEGVLFTASLLIGYSVALIMQCLITILDRIYFSTKNSIIPFWGSLICAVANFLIAYLLLNFTGIGIYGIPVAYSIASLLDCTFLILLFKTRIPSYKFSANTSTIVKSLICTVVMGVLIYVIDLYAMPALFGGYILEIRKLMQFLWVSIELIIGITAYMSLAYLIGCEEARDLVHIASAKIKKIIGK
ncbi:MAG: murein biosynthesis integral membrane protein MurJ [Clostridia bacterium]